MNLRYVSIPNDFHIIVSFISHLKINEHPPVQLSYR
jgi:hypothetical protein